MQSDLATAYLILSENDGRNWIQLVKWAGLRVYLRAFFEYDLFPACSDGELPEETEPRSRAMWLLSNSSNDAPVGDPEADVENDPRFKRIVVAIVFATSHAYPIAYYPWYFFLITNATDLLPPDIPLIQSRPLTPVPRYNRLSSMTTYLMNPIRISIPLMSEAALSLYYKDASPTHSTKSRSDSPSPSVIEVLRPTRSMKYDNEWLKLTLMCDPMNIRDMPKPGFLYVNGSFTGTFEGKFVLPARDVIGWLNRGDPPIPAYDEVFKIGHFQTWNAAENHSKQPSKTSSRYRSTPPLPGPATNAHLPLHARIVEEDDGIELHVPGDGIHYYEKWKPGSAISSPKSEVVTLEEADFALSPQERVNIIVTGTAVDHIQAPLRGRTMMPPGSTAQGTIRPDGQILLVVRPNIEGSGVWLYICHLTPEGDWRGYWRVLTNDLTGIVCQGVFFLQRV
ncbi:hypothetical protein FRC02_003818 [Tulasnella sp. 418]|nr:hypothetical protein FRC02_003818 [Tulasnella sp. 418]